MNGLGHLRGTPFWGVHLLGGAARVRIGHAPGDDNQPDHPRKVGDQATRIRMVCVFREAFDPTTHPVH